MKLKHTILIAGILAATAPFANASPIEIVPGATIDIGELHFANFSVGGPFAGSGNFVEASYVSGTYYLAFNGPWLAADGAAIDFPIRYTVTSTGKPINMIDQSFTFGAGGNGGSITISESVWTGGFGGEEVAHSSLAYLLPIIDTSDPFVADAVGDDLIIDPAEFTLFVEKDVQLRSAQGGYVESTIITQSFHVPDGGATAMLLGIGILGLGAIRRRES